MASSDLIFPNTGALANTQSGYPLDAELRDMQQQVGQLLARQAALYTGQDSSSLPAEKMAALLDSILFTVSAALDTEAAGGSNAGFAAVSDLFARGIKIIEEQVGQGKKLLLKAQMTVLDIDNADYHDSYKELSIFFKNYDIRFFASDIPCMITYPLCGHPCTGSGVFFINTYLRRLILENMLLRRFPRPDVLRLLRVYVPDYRQQLINLLEPVLTNALGLTLLNADASALNITPDQRRQLEHLLREKDPGLLLSDAAVRLAGLLAPGNLQAADYIAQAAALLARRLSMMPCTALYDNIFLDISG